MKRRVCCLLMGLFVLCLPAQQVWAAPIGPAGQAEEKKEEEKKPHENTKKPDLLGEKPIPPIGEEKPIPPIGEEKPMPPHEKKPILPHEKKEAKSALEPESVKLPEQEKMKDSVSDIQQKNFAVVEQDKPGENNTEEADTTLQQQVVTYALQFVGNPYKYGGTSLTNGADCSGFVQSVYEYFDYNLSRTSKEQAKTAGYKDVSLKESELQQGDLIFYANSNGIVYHVAIYIGEGKIVHAANAKKGITISEYTYMKPYKARRVIE